MECPTVRIKSTNPDVPYIVINESDYDPEKHELLETPPLTAAQIREKLTAAGVEFKTYASKTELLELLATVEG